MNNLTLGVSGVRWKVVINTLTDDNPRHRVFETTPTLPPNPLFFPLGNKGWSEEHPGFFLPSS